MSELLKISEVAEILGISPDSVTRKFSKVKGVADIGSPETQKKRRYRVLRIPVSVVEKYLRERGGPVTVSVPERKSVQRKHPDPLSEDELARQLAAVTKQHGSQAQKTLDRIAERARLMQLVPEDQWENMVWLEVCQLFCVNDQVFVFWDGCAREGAASLPSPSDVERFCAFMTRLSPVPAFVPATES